MEGAARTAAALLIGNELLSGKVHESNLVELARTLRSLGVALRRVVMLPDEMDAIAAEVRALSDTHDVVFTSGGVGPTHDDITLEAVAPEGAELVSHAEARWPTVVMKNVWVLPGVPEAFRMKLGVVRAKVRGASRFVTREVITKMDEPDLKPLLDRIVAAHPDVEIGSYPKWFDPRYKTKVTFDGTDEQKVVAAREDFVAQLPEGEPQTDL